MTSRGKTDRNDQRGVGRAPLISNYPTFLSDEQYGDFGDHRLGDELLALALQGTCKHADYT